MPHINNEGGNDPHAAGWRRRATSTTAPRVDEHRARRLRPPACAQLRGPRVPPGVDPDRGRTPHRGQYHPLRKTCPPGSFDAAAGMESPGGRAALSSAATDRCRRLRHAGCRDGLPICRRNVPPRSGGMWHETVRGWSAERIHQCGERCSRRWRTFLASVTSHSNRSWTGDFPISKVSTAKNLQQVHIRARTRGAFTDDLAFRASVAQETELDNRTIGQQDRVAKSKCKVHASPLICRRTYRISRRGVDIPLRQPLAGRLHPVVTIPRVGAATARRTTSPPVGHADRLGQRLDSVLVDDRPVSGRPTGGQRSGRRSPAGHRAGSGPQFTGASIRARGPF